MTQESLTNEYFHWLCEFVVGKTVLKIYIL